MKVFIPFLAALVAEALQGFALVPIIGAFEPPEGRVLLNPGEGPLRKVLLLGAAADGLDGARLATAGLHRTQLLLLLGMLGLLGLLGGSFCRTWSWPSHKGPDLVEQLLYGEVTARGEPRHCCYRTRGLVLRLRQWGLAFRGRCLPILGQWPQDHASSY